jgi:Ras-related protein Rab-7A
MAKNRSQLKVIVLGDSGVGKTSLLNRFVKEEFSQLYRATIGADFLSKEVVIEDKHISLQLWDTAGQERFQSLGMAFYRGADLCILVYDITSLKTFESITTWKQEFLNQSCPSHPESFPFMVLGNKCDLDPDRAVSQAKANQWARDHDLPLIETSAKDDVRIQDAFIEAAKKAIKREVFSAPVLTNNKVILTPKAEAPKKKKCCN